ncbi:Chaperone protein DnaJ [Halomicronema hongdechloris C2206]|uniref:Chaperone protein DnaJ n=1 Tax=Halomicronema hongdechloris C2206 TaxID=1641165 RepID=A0A1Z3HN76_9CYAN|nr:J domain-containing protein [Halomicronema hongdechloris]ASC71597.1 Chaperone protein DnaJ [Halomicronema hongdechloris C2206]
MNIEQGLFKQDFTDYHAILGVSVEADPKQVRKRYLRIARKLHPDTLASAHGEARQRASELLSKLVNPAYEKLSDEKAANEYALLLKLKGRQLNNQMATIALDTDVAQQLASSKNLEFAYSEALQTLAGKQYDSLEHVFDVIGQISELNLVYLMRRAQTDTSSPPGQSSPSAPGQGLLRRQRRHQLPPPLHRPPPAGIER